MITNNKESEHFIEESSEECNINLSSDKKWMRLVVDGKLVASFHVNYVNKILLDQNKTKETSKPRRKETNISM